MFSFKKKGGLGLASVTFCADGVSISHVTTNSISGKHELLVCDFVSCSSPLSYRNALAALVKKHKLQHVNCNLILQPKDYELHLLERPEVQDNEIIGAITYQISDFIDYPVEDCVLQYSSLPATEDTSKGSKIYGIVAKKNVIENLADFIHGADLELSYVDIPEFAVRNLVACSDFQDNTVGFVEIETESSHLMVFQSGLFYMSRTINIGYEYLIREDERDEMSSVGKFNIEHCDELLLELQRSLDYCVSEFGTQLPSHIIISPIPVQDEHHIHNYLKQYLRQEVMLYEANTYIKCHDEFDRNVQMHALLTIGGALRYVD